MPKFNAMRKMFGMPEVSEDDMQQNEQPPKLSGLALMNQAVKDSLAGPAPQGFADIKQSAMNPTEAQQQLGEQVTAGVGGAVGSLGSGIKPKEAIARAEAMLAENAPVRYSADKIAQGRQALQENFMNNPNVAQETRIRAAKKLAEYERKAGIRGIKLPE